MISSAANPNLRRASTPEYSSRISSEKHGLNLPDGEEKKVRTRRLKPSFFQMPRADSWTPATTAGGCCTNWRQELELPKLTFQVIRRTIATLAQKKGTVKDVQGVLRHSRAATTTDVYMQEIPESVQTTVDAINAELRVEVADSR